MNAYYMNLLQKAVNRKSTDYRCRHTERHSQICVCFFHPFLECCASKFYYQWNLKRWFFIKKNCHSRNQITKKIGPRYFKHWITDVLKKYQRNVVQDSNSGWKRSLHVKIFAFSENSLLNAVIIVFNLSQEIIWVIQSSADFACYFHCTKLLTNEENENNKNYKALGNCNIKLNH